MAIQNVSQSANLTSLASGDTARNRTDLPLGEVAKANGHAATEVVPAGSQVTFPDVFVEGTHAQSATAAESPQQPSFSVAGGSTEDQIAQQIARLQEPALPAEGASPAQLADYQQKLQRYSRTMDMLTKIQEALHEMKKNIIANFRV
jgi:hypothetical protein